MGKIYSLQSSWLSSADMEVVASISSCTAILTQSGPASLLSGRSHSIRAHSHLIPARRTCCSHRNSGPSPSLFSGPDADVLRPLHLVITASKRNVANQQSSVVRPGLIATQFEAPARNHCNLAELQWRPTCKRSVSARIDCNWGGAGKGGVFCPSTVHQISRFSGRRP